MLQHMKFNLSRGYLSKTTLVEKEKEMDEGIVTRILSDLPTGDKIECYHGVLPSGLTDGDMVFDYLILYKTGDKFKPIVVKNAVSYGCYMKCFEKYYEPGINEFQDMYFDDSYYELNEFLHFICETSREKFCKFLEEKYDVIRQDVLMFS